MVIGQRRGSRAGIVAFGLLALGAVDACGSRSPLMETFEGVAGGGETGGSGGSAANGTGGVGTGGDYPGQGGAYPMGAGGDYPGQGGTGGANNGAGGSYPAAGGAYPMQVGGAYPYGGVGGVGIGMGGKGMGPGGKGGGGKGDMRLFKACTLTCDKYERQCPEDAGDSCVEECVFAGNAVPRCANMFANWIFCLNDNMAYDAKCSQDTCDGPSGCLHNAQELCVQAEFDITNCIGPGNGCSASGEFYSTGCRIQTDCDPSVYITSCLLINPDTEEFNCTCSSGDEGASTAMYGTFETVCYDMQEACGFPQILTPLPGPQ